MCRLALIAALLTLLPACSSTPEEETLASLDIVDSTAMQSDVFVPQKSEEEIKAAYYAYIEQARSGERARLFALNRLADMEIERAVSALKHSEDGDQSSDALYLQTLNRTRELLETSLRDYPDEPDNDKVLYRLAHINDQLGDGDASLQALTQLVSSHSDSPHYAEAQFRLAERAFLEEDYISAEDAYTEVIYSRYNGDFVARSYFKRGWSRYKQGLYTQAADDHLEAIRQQAFATYDELEEDEQRIFNEHFRAIALAFAHASDTGQLFEFFQQDGDTEYLYHTCRALSDVYLYQERFSDAAQVLAQFVEQQPADARAPAAGLQAIDIWRSAGFRSRYLEELDNFYNAYNPTSAYWTARPETASNEIEALKDHLLAAASHYHRQYSDSNDTRALDQASRWYERYLSHYAAQAQKDGVRLLYGDLLASTGRKADAVEQYEAAAFDNKIILDKAAAYATISLLSDLIDSGENGIDDAWLRKYLDYATSYAQFYPVEQDTQQLVIHGAELAYKLEHYQEAVALSNLLSPAASSDAVFTAQLIKARSLLELGSLLEAEELLLGLLAGDRAQSQRRMVSDNLALLLYRRGDASRSAGQVDDAIEDFARIADLAPSSDIAPRGLYDAVVLAMEQEKWTLAITHMEAFQRLYPTHERVDDVTRRLSQAYLKAERYAQAAETLEKVSTDTADGEVKMAALWKAAELYEQEGDVAAAIRSYRSYAHSYKRPYPQYMEAMFRLTKLYDNQGDDYRRNFWEARIAEADAGAAASLKTDRTNFISASCRLQAARRKLQAFTNVQLVEPLQENLRAKKQRMEEAIELYSQAASYNLSEIATEATYAIADIYRQFAGALLDSERPSGLSGTELAQYEILIEDQAFPFEEMAVEFHEINVSRIAQGTVNDWVISSLEELRQLFPVRYGRKGKIAAFRN